MKKHNLKTLAFTPAFCISAALTVFAATQAPGTNSIPMEQAYNSSNVLNTNLVSTAEAYENNEVNSLEEQTKSEESRRTEIAKQYSIYNPYGMTYNKEKDRFFYNGQMVRYFKDQISAEHTNSFFFEDGVIDVEPVRDTNGTLTGLKQASDADFIARTEKQEKIKTEFEAAGITENSGSFELGDPNYRDDSLDTYTTFGVSYNQSTQKWMYNRKIIHILYDADHNTYYDSSASDGINLKVVRDKSGNIEKLLETEALELEQYVK